MTATCAILSKQAITFSCDSFITSLNSNGDLIIEEAQQSKILKLERLHAVIGYWGLARYGTWKTRDWLNEQVRDLTMPNTLELWSKELSVRLDQKLRSLSNQAWSYGIGIHVAGYESFEGELLPEMYLVTNYSGISETGGYSVGNEMSATRRTYFDSTGGQHPNVYEHGNPQYRNAMKTFFSERRWMLFNNGDTPLFGTIANGIGRAVNLALSRGNLDRSSPMETQRNYAFMVIRTVSEFERLFFREDSRVVGGRPHDITVLPDRTYFSSSGD